jgi:hypothetical protein
VYGQKTTQQERRHYGFGRSDFVKCFSLNFRQQRLDSTPSWCIAGRRHCVGMCSYLHARAVLHPEKNPRQSLDSRLDGPHTTLPYKTWQVSKTKYRAFVLYRTAASAVWQCETSHTGQGDGDGGGVLATACTRRLSGFWFTKRSGSIRILWRIYERLTRTPWEAAVAVALYNASQAGPQFSYMHRNVHI